MMLSLPRILTSLLCISLASAQSSGQCKINSLEASYAAPVAADGWSYRLVATELSRPRGILFDTEGALIVVDTGVGLVHLELEDQRRTCLRVRKKTVLLENEDLNHGIAISKDGRTLYASTDDEVYSWSYDPSAVRLSESSERTLVTNMTNSGHTSRTLLLSEKHPGVLVVSRGSQGNDDVEAEDRSTGHSQLRAFNVSALGEKSKPYDYLDGDLLGWGLRNSVGVAEHPETGGVYSVENSVDNLRRRGPRHPPRQPSRRAQLSRLPQRIPLGDLETGDQFPADRTGGRSAPSDEECNTEYVPPVLAFQAHTAPLDIKFDGNGTKAYISFHGSWNRDEPVGYEISSVAFKDGRPTSPSNSTNATTTIISNPDLSNCPGECFRPVGLAWDSEGRLWFSSDSTGEIFVLAQDGSENSNNNNDDDDRGESGGDDDDSAASQFMRPSSWAVVVTLVAVIMGFFLA
ncbi:hypothetical protein NW754_003552 [Fusarium falciforme]|nr:hypothetical protein NW754_003552 [Fusarium falciforme]